MIGTCPCDQGMIFPSSQMLSAVRIALEVELMSGPNLRTPRPPQSKASGRSGLCQPRRPGEDAQLPQRLGAPWVALHGLLVLALRLPGLAKRLVHVPLVEVGPVEGGAPLHGLGEEPECLVTRDRVRRSPGVGRPPQQSEKLAFLGL